LEKVVIAPRFVIEADLSDFVTQYRVRDNLLNKHSISYSAIDALHLAAWLNDREKSYTLTEADIRERIDSL
jgi:hypothetical protein